jgi:APA family basic amino acid/polyamine antiporter
VTGIFVSFAFIGIGLWRLPDIFPKRYEHSFYKLPRPVVKIVAAGNTIVSLVLAGLVALGQPSALALVLTWMVLSYVFYRYRLYTHMGGGGKLQEKMQELHSHE